MVVRTKRVLLGVFLAGIIGLPAAHRARANDNVQNAPAQAGQQAPRIEAKADQMLRQMSDYLDALPAFSVQAESTTEVVLTTGEKLQFDASSQIHVRRPNRLVSERRGSLVDATLYYDGKTISLMGHRRNLYATVAAPASLDDMIDFARKRFDIDAPGADLIYSKAYSGLVEDVVSGMYIGKSEIDGTVCHQLSFRGNETDWQIWIQDGAQPLPRKYVIVSKKVTELPEFEVRLHDWQVDPTLPDSLFTFSPPYGAQRVEFPNASGTLLLPRRD